MLPFDRLDELRKTRPLIHCIANMVSAKRQRAAGVWGSPMMAQAREEMEEIAAISSATVMNTGTSDREKFTACGLSGDFAQLTRAEML